MQNEIEDLVQQYISSCPSYQFPPSGDRHPAVLALGIGMREWLISRLGGPIPYWQAMLDAARIWFPPGTDSREFRIFCNLFEGAGNVGGDGFPEYDAIAEQYLAWRRSCRAN